MVCDSTNVFVDGEAGSEADVRDALTQLIGGAEGQGRRGLLRLQRRAHGQRRSAPPRPPAAASAWSAARCTAWPRAAKSVGLFQGLEPFVADNEAKRLPRRQGPLPVHRQPGRAARGPVAHRRGHPPAREAGAGRPLHLLRRGSSPATRSRSATCRTSLADRGVRLYTERDHPGIHVSGHPCRDELAADVPVGAAADRRPDPRRAPPPAGARRLRPRPAGPAGRRAAQRRHGPPGPGPRRDHRRGARRAASMSTAAC